MSVCCECCALSGRGPCDGLITLPEESTECGVPECDREASIMVSGPLGTLTPWKRSIDLEQEM
jgi:hypothetical protein